MVLYRGSGVAACQAVSMNVLSFTAYSIGVDEWLGEVLAGPAGGCRRPRRCVWRSRFCAGRAQEASVWNVRSPRMLCHGGPRARLGRISRHTTSVTTIGAKFVCGEALAGLSNWTLSYPFDVIRTRLASGAMSALDAASLGQLWRGYPLCAQGVIVNAAVF